MAVKSSIEWCDSTWNPTTGCTMAKGSETGGCLNCYAARVALRRPEAGLAIMRDSGPRWTGKIEFSETRLLDPLHWRKPRRIFVNSMSDLFHESLTDGQILRVFDVMARCPRHTFQVLTKRPERMLDWARKWADTKEADYEPKLARGPEAVRKAHTCGRALMFASMLEAMGTPPPGAAYPTYDWLGGMCRWPNWLPNVWLGVSVENQKTADARIPLLLQTPAAIRFVSYEPALGPVGFAKLFPSSHGMRNDQFWVIVGGESGPGARPFNLRYAYDTIKQCSDAGVACFVKQLGAKPGTPSCADFECTHPDCGVDWLKLGDPKGGDPREWPKALRVRQFPEARRVTRV